MDLRRSIVFFVLLIPIGLYGQEPCYERFLGEGIQAYENYDYRKAIVKFEAAAICTDRRRTDEEVGEWLEKSREAYISAIRKCKNELESLKSNEQQLALRAQSLQDSINKQQIALQKERKYTDDIIKAIENSSIPSNIGYYSGKFTGSLEVELSQGNFMGEYRPNQDFLMKIFAFANTDLLEGENIETEVTITGNADGSNIAPRGIPYQGEFGEVIQVDYYSMNQQALKRTTINKGQIIRDNETLALLRAYGIKYFLTGNQVIKENEVDIQTAIHLEHGSEYRQVELLIKKYKG